MRDNIAVFLGQFFNTVNTAKYLGSQHPPCG